MDLFDDLPEPAQTSAAGSTNEEEAAAQEEKGEEEEEEEERRLKRKREDEEEEEEEEERRENKKVCKEGVPQLRGFVAARRGERDEMQDAHVLLPDMTGCLSAPGRRCRLSYFAVFDGHGGARASRFAAENLHHNVAKRFPSGETENVDQLIKKCLVDSFRQTDEDFLKRASSQKPVWKDGSTATCVLVVDDMVYVANLGDSKALLCRMEGGSSPLSSPLSSPPAPPAPSPWP